MKYKTILMLLRIFDSVGNVRTEAWLSNCLRRHTKSQLRKLGLNDE